MLKQKVVIGYTLIEILVVLFIISIVSGVVLLTVGRQTQQNVKSFQDEVVQMMRFAKEQAILRPVILMVQVERHAFQFFSYQAGTQDKESTWVPLDDRFLGIYTIPNGIEVRVEILHNKQDEDQEQPARTRIVFSSNGDMTPFKMTVGLQGNSPAYLIMGDEDGNITSKELP